MKLPNAIDRVEIGDVFVSSWGYDQTNVDFYRVTRKTKAMIELSPIPGRLKDAPGYSSMAGEIEPDLDAEPGEPIGLKRPAAGARDVTVRMNSFSSAKKIDNPASYSTYVSWYA